MSNGGSIYDDVVKKTRKSPTSPVIVQFPDIVLLLLPLPQLPLLLFVALVVLVALTVLAVGLLGFRVAVVAVVAVVVNVAGYLVVLVIAVVVLALLVVLRCSSRACSSRVFGRLRRLPPPPPAGLADLLGFPAPKGKTLPFACVRTAFLIF